MRCTPLRRLPACQNRQRSSSARITAAALIAHLSRFHPCVSCPRMLPFSGATCSDSTVCTCARPHAHAHRSHVSTLATATDGMKTAMRPSAVRRFFSAVLSTHIDVEAERVCRDGIQRGRQRLKTTGLGLRQRERLVRGRTAGRARRHGARAALAVNHGHLVERRRAAAHGQEDGACCAAARSDARKGASAKTKTSLSWVCVRQRSAAPPACVCVCVCVCVPFSLGRPLWMCTATMGDSCRTHTHHGARAATDDAGPLCVSITSHMQMHACVFLLACSAHSTYATSRKNARCAPGPMWRA
jgi:hypothetical protein